MLLTKGSRGSFVAALQTFLKINADGEFGANTELAVKAFQAENNLREDGRAGDNTLAVARSLGLKFPAESSALDNARVDTLLPESGTGYQTYNREKQGADQYGTAFTIAGLTALAADWNKLHPEVLLQIGDISRQGGGAFPPHASHKNGRDADIRPIRLDNRTEPVTVTDKAYDSKRTEELVRLIRRSYPKAIIYLNDPRLMRLGLTMFCTGHHNHLHVRLK